MKSSLIKLIKQTELELRSQGQIRSQALWERFSELDEWEYRIVQDAIVRIHKFIESGNMNFVYKVYENLKDPDSIPKREKQYDLLIVTTKRDERDTVLTDVKNRLVVPKELTWNTLEIWGMDVVSARNLAAEKACEFGCEYLLFIDDDMVVPNNALMRLYNEMSSANGEVEIVSGEYFRKVDPLISAHGKVLENIDEERYLTDMCAMGFTLIDIDSISKKVPLPLFWAFGDPKDNYWSMGEDAFFSFNYHHATGKRPLIVKNLGILHYDKMNKRMYGERRSELTYATNAIESADQFERLRVPERYPLIMIGVPARTEKDPIACEFGKMKILRGYRCVFERVSGMKVDEARNELARRAMKSGAEYLLFVDNDIVPPEDGLCKLLETMETNKNIGMVSGDYTLKGIPNDSAHLCLDEGIVAELNRIKNREKDGKVECDWLCALGFALIRTSCFNQIRYPWFLCHSKDAKEAYVNEDAHFTELLMESGYKVIIDKSIQCKHIDFANKKVYGYNNNQVYCEYDWIEEMEKVNYEQ